jgi:V/A-type H+-transporting ATPase subunit D
MAKIKLTKGELKRQRDSLGQYRHYLPTLQLKKQQFQIKIFEKRKLLREEENKLKEQKRRMSRWTGLLADPGVDLKEWVIPKEVQTEVANIAGAIVPALKGISFKQVDYDFYSMPFWVDRGVVELRKWVSLLIEIKIIKEQLVILERELRIITQRVNLFEKVKIPECLENIRKIRIYLGDQQANAVGISKVAKKKIESISLQGTI